MPNHTSLKRCFLINKPKGYTLAQHNCTLQSQTKSSLTSTAHWKWCEPGKTGGGRRLEATMQWGGTNILPMLRGLWSKYIKTVNYHAHLHCRDCFYKKYVMHILTIINRKKFHAEVTLAWKKTASNITLYSDIYCWVTNNTTLWFSKYYINEYA